MLFIYCTLSSSPSPKTSAVTTPVRYGIHVVVVIVVQLLLWCDRVVDDAPLWHNPS